MNLLLLLLLPFGLQAQETTLETIKIQSNKETRSLEQMTESVSVVPATELDSPMQKNNLEVINALPNVSINKLDGTFSIRGVNNTGVTGFAKDNVSSILLDDIYLTDLAVKAGAFDLWDINHIELYRGPQSTSQGINSLAGSISLFKNKATVEQENAVKLGLGNFGTFEAGLLHNNSALDGKFRYRIAYNREQTDGYIKNITTQNANWGRREKDNVNLDLQYFLNDTDYVRVNGKFSQTNNGGIYVQGSNPFNYEVSEDVDFQTKTGTTQQSIRYFNQLNEDLSNEVILAHSQAGNSEKSDMDWTATNTLGTRQENHDDSFISAENLLKYKSGNHQNIFGLHTHQFNLKDYDAMKLVVGIPLDVVQRSDKTRTVLAVFDSYTHTFNERHNITLGLRFEHVINDYQMDLVAPPIRDNSVQNTSYNNVFLPKIAYTYVVEKNTYGFSVSEGYRTGGVSVNRWQGVANEYSPEKTINYEISYKHQGPALHLYTNLFYTDWKDQQVQVQKSTNPFDTIVENAAASDLYGAEAETRYQLTAAQNIALGVGYTKTHFKDFRSATTDYANNEFAYAPQWTGRLLHNLQISDQWNTAVALRYIGSSYTNAENTKNAPEQFYLDVGSQYLWTTWGLMTDFYVKNILNQQYELVASNPFNGVRDFQVSTPTEFGVRLIYNW